MKRPAHAEPAPRYCSTTAFGSTGPFVDRPGFDPVLQGMAGINGAPGLRRPSAIPAHRGGRLLRGRAHRQAVLAALFVRERTGLGQKVETRCCTPDALQAGNFVDYPGKQSVFRTTDVPALPRPPTASGFPRVRQPVVLVKLARRWGSRISRHDRRLRVLDAAPRQPARCCCRFSSPLLSRHAMPGGGVCTRTTSRPARAHIDEFRRHPLTRHHGGARVRPPRGRPLPLPGSRRCSFPRRRAGRRPVADARATYRTTSCARPATTDAALADLRARKVIR